CDAWVVGALSPRAYAAAILETLDFLAENPHPLPLAGSGLSRVHLLKRRFMRIMHRRTPKELSRGAWAVLAGVAPMLFLGAVLAPPDARKPARPLPPPPGRAVPAAATEPTVFSGPPTNLLGGAREIFSVAVSPDGRLLATGGGHWDRPGDVKVWDLARRVELASYPEPLGVAS